MILEIIFPLIILIMIGAFGLIAPLLQPQNILFGVRIPARVLEIKKDRVDKFKRNFILKYLVIDLLWIIFSVFLILQYGMERYLITIAGQLLLQFGLYIYQNKAVENWKADIIRDIPEVKSKTKAKVIDSSYRKERLTISKRWYLIPLGLLIFQIAMNLINYDTIIGQTEQVRQISSFVLSSFFIFMILIWQNYVIANAKQNIRAGEPEKSREQNIIFRRRWSLYMFIVLSLIIFANLILNLVYLDILKWNLEITENLYFIIPVVTLLGSLILSIIMGQSGARIKLTHKKSDSDYDDIDDDQYWKFGIFYYNPQDPSVFIEKRMGIGWTLNFGNPKSLIFILSILAIVVISMFTGK